MRVSAFFRPSFGLRASAFGFDPLGYKKDAPNGAFRSQPFSVPIGIAARHGARALPPLVLWRRGLGRGGPGCFSQLPPRDLFQRGPPPAHLAGILSATASSPWPFSSKEERETALRPANSEIRCNSREKAQEAQNIMLLCTAIVEIAGRRRRNVAAPRLPIAPFLSIRICFGFRGSNFGFPAPPASRRAVLQTAIVDGHGASWRLLSHGHDPAPCLYGISGIVSRVY